MMNEVLRITSKQCVATSNFAHMIQRALLAVCLTTFVLVYSCGPDNGFTPCPKGKSPLADTVFKYESAFYEEPKNFTVYPNSVINLSHTDQARFEVNAQANLLYRFQSFQQEDTFNLDFKSCIFKYRALQMNLKASKIESLTTFDSCAVYMDAGYTANSFMLRAGTRTKATIQGNIKKLDVRSKSSDTLLVTGIHPDFASIQRGSGSIDASTATISTAIVTNLGTGHIYLPTCDSVNITITNEGNVYYQGEPRYLSTTITGKGQAIKVE